MAKSRKKGKKKSAQRKMSKMARAGKRPAARRKVMKKAAGKKVRARLLKLPSLKSLSKMKVPKVPKIKAPKIPKAMRIPSIRVPKLPSISAPVKPVKRLVEKTQDHASHLWLAVKPGGQEGEAGTEEATIQKFVKQALAKHCKSCGRPLAGVGGFFSKLAGHKRSEKDPNCCNECG